ncbi:hypothetical protein D3C77_585030 [compost metagenome]
MNNTANFVNDLREMIWLYAYEDHVAPLNGFNIARCDDNAGISYGQQLRLLFTAVADIQILRVQCTGAQECSD